MTEASSNAKPDSDAKSYPIAKINIETQLKEFWAQYIRHVEENGHDDRARMLKRRYFQLFANYRSNRKWLKILDS